MCCNGSLFADVRLQAGDDARRLAELGLPLVRRGAVRRFGQPCSQLAGGYCKIYENRPQHCRLFDCALLKAVKSGEIQLAAGLRIARQARRGAEQVLGLLRALGDTDEHKPLAARVRQTGARLAEVGLDQNAARTYGKLTVAAHDLNFLLGDRFYPGWR